MKTYLWIRKYVRLHPSGSGNSSLSREALAIEELVALRGCCEKRNQTVPSAIIMLRTCPLSYASLCTGPMVPEQSLISQHTHSCFSWTALCVSMNFCSSWGATCTGRGPPICAVGLPPASPPMPSPDSLINWLLISFYLRLHVCFTTLYGGDRAYINTYLYHIIWWDSKCFRKD